MNGDKDTTKYKITRLKSETQLLAKNNIQLNYFNISELCKKPFNSSMGTHQNVLSIALYIKNLGFKILQYA